MPHSPTHRRHQFSIARQQGRRKMTRCICVLFILVCILAAACICALVAVTYLVVEPYSRTAHYVDTLCRPLSTVYTPDPIPCSCGQHCLTELPCLVVFVEYSDKESHLYRSVMKENDALISQKCTLTPACDSPTVSSNGSLREYEQKFGDPSRPAYSCHYNPIHPQIVIRSRRFTVHHVIHGVVWASLLLVLSIGTLLIIFKRNRCAFERSLPDQL